MPIRTAEKEKFLHNLLFQLGKVVIVVALELLAVFEVITLNEEAGAQAPCFCRIEMAEKPTANLEGCKG